MKKLSLEKRWIVFLILAAAGFIIYSNTFRSEFLFDDIPGITAKPRLTTFKTFTELSYWTNLDHRPLSEFTFAVNYSLGGYNVAGYHLVNILIHILNSWLVYLLMLRLLSFKTLIDKTPYQNRHLLALFIALLFIAHPIQTQAVSYTIQRMTILSSLFYLLAVYLYLLGRLEYLHRQNRTRSVMLLLLASFSGLLAILSKQDAITFPAAFALVELFFIRTAGGKPCRKYLTAFISLLCLIVLLVVLTGHLPAETDTITRKDYLLTQFRVIINYIQLLFVPVNQNIDYDIGLSTTLWSFPVIGSLLIILALLALSVILYRKKRLISFAIIWFFLTLSITSSVIPIKDVLFEHRLYLPIIGFNIAVVYAGAYFLAGKRRTLLVVLLALIVLALSAGSFRRNQVWKTEYSLWKDSASKSPRNRRPWNNLGLALQHLGRTGEAKQAFEQSLRIDANYPIALNNLGYLYYAEGDPEAAFSRFTEAIRLDSTYTDALNNAGGALVRMKRAPEAVSYYERAVRSSPDYGPSYHNLAIAYMHMNDFNKALETIMNFLAVKPDDPDGLSWLGECYYYLLQFQDAVISYQKAIRLAPGSYYAYSGLGNTFLAMGDADSARDCFMQALRIQPGYEPARLGLAKLKR